MKTGNQEGMTTNNSNKITKNRSNQMKNFTYSNTNTISLNAFAFMTSKELDLEIRRQVDAMRWDTIVEHVCDQPFLARWMCSMWFSCPSFRDILEERVPLMLRYLSEEKLKSLRIALSAKMEEMKDADSKVQLMVVSHT